MDSLHCMENGCNAIWYFHQETALERFCLVAWYPVLDSLRLENGMHHNLNHLSNH